MHINFLSLMIIFIRERSVEFNLRLISIYTSYKISANFVSIVTSGKLVSAPSKDISVTINRYSQLNSRAMLNGRVTK